MSSLTRAFTNRRGKASVDSTSQNIRSKISAPLQLVHTTNMLSYNAPDISSRSVSSGSVSTKYEDDSDSTTTTTSAPSTAPTSPEVDMHDHYDNNRLSSCFVAPSSTASSSPVVSSPDAPAIPRRAPSHTKKNSFDALARSRSVSQASRMSRESGRTVSSKPSLTFSRSPSISTTSSGNSQLNNYGLSAKSSMPNLQHHHHLSTPKLESSSESHPFGQELAQVTEIAEEYGLSDKLRRVDQEEQELLTKGFCKFGANEYIKEIDALFASFFPDATYVYSEPKRQHPEPNFAPEVAWI